MLSPLAAWRVSLQRMRSDWPIVAAAWLITLLSATLLAAGPIYSDAVSLAGLRRVLADAPPTEANIEVTALVPPAEVALTTATVERELTAAVAGVGAEIERSAESGTFALPRQPAGELRDLATLGFVDGVAEHATLLQGAWPAPAAGGDEPIGVAVSDAIAAELGWTVGDVLRLTNRRDESHSVEVRVAGIYVVDDAEDPFWWGAELAGDGMTESASYRTFGPLIAADTDLLVRAASGDVRVTWRAFPNFEALALGEMAGLRARVAMLPDRVDFALSGLFPTARTGLDAILADAQRSLLVSRTGVLLVIVQLAILAAYAIVLTAGLLADHRRLDTALLRCRGAGAPQVAFLALTEAVVLAAPAAVTAPLLAAAALSLFNFAGPLAAVEIAIEPLLSVEAFIVAAGAAMGAALLLVVPAFLAARSFVDEEGGRSRFETRTIGQRLGIDVALLAVTAVGFWQLRLYGSPLTASVHGVLGLDPLLVAAPAIGLLAGGVLALRVVPLLAHLAEIATRRGRRLVGSLGAQQIARRPLRYTRAALLLMLAVSMGVFAISYADTWHASQQDQAAYQVGADVRLEASGGAGTVPAWALGTALARVEGVREVMGVDRQSLRLPGATRQGELVALDPARASAIVTIREDLSSAPLGSLLQPLAAARPAPALVRLDSAPRRLRVDARVTFERLIAVVYDPEAGEWVDEPRDPADLEGRRVVGAEVVVRDAAGVTQRFTASPVPLGSEAQGVAIPLVAGTPRAEAAVAEIGGAFAAPLEILSVDLTVTLPAGWLLAGGRIELEGLATSDDESGEAWRPIDLDAAGGWTLSVIRNQGSRTEPVPAQVEGRALVLDGQGATGTIVAPQTNLRPPAVSFTAASLDALAESALPVVVNRAFLDATSTGLGDEVTARLDGLLRRLVVVGAVESFPTGDPGTPLAVADLSSLGLLRYASAQSTQGPNEWWLASEPGRGTQVAATIDQGPYLQGRVTSLAEQAGGLSTDPVALGIIGALSLGFLVAGLFASIGLVVSASVAARQRRTEFALLRALGLSPGELSGWLWLENAGIVTVSLAAGVGLGLLIGWVALPFVTVTQQAGSPFPPPLVRTPWASIALLMAVSSVALGLTVLVLGRVLRGIGIGSVLRMGED